MKALSAHNLNLSFANTQVLKNFSLELQQGEILCLLGPSGCGKTTALKTIAGLLPSDNGRIELFGNTVVDERFNLPPQQRQIGFIFQDYALFPHMTVAKNIAYGLTSLAKEEQLQRIRDVLTLVELPLLANRYPHELSGGQQQRIALARALANKPKLLLMDEPFSNVDTQVKRRMMAELRALLKQAGISVIFVTHAKDEAFAFADKTAVMINGALQQCDTPAQVFNNPANLNVAHFMEAGNLCPQHYLDQIFVTQSLQGIKDITGTALFKRHLLSVHPTHNGNGMVSDIQFTGRGHLISIEFPQLSIDNWQAECDEQPAVSIGDKVSLSYRDKPVNLNGCPDEQTI